VILPRGLSWPAVRLLVASTILMLSLIRGSAAWAARFGDALRYPFPRI